MAGKRQLTPMEVFEANIGDAERLIAFARSLENSRRWTRASRPAPSSSSTSPKESFGHSAATGRRRDLNRGRVVRRRESLLLCFRRARFAPEPTQGRDVPLDAVIEIESRYQRRRVGHRAILREFVEHEANPSPSRIVFATVDQRDVLKKVDVRRGLPNGTSGNQLETLSRRRNKIAHTGDRTPSGRPALALGDVDGSLETAKEIVTAMEDVLP